MNPESMMDLLKANKNTLDLSTSAGERMKKLFDDGVFTELDTFAQANVVTGFGEVDGETVFAFAQNGGAVNAAQAGKIKKVYEMAAKVGAPIVGLYDSNGADVSDPQVAMASYSEILAKANQLSGVVPQIAVVCGVCAGVAALAACSADVVVMSKEGELFVTAPFITKALNDDTEGAGTAENAVKAGVAHLLAENEDKAIAEARKILALLPINNLSMLPLCEFTAPAGNESLVAACENFEGGLDIDAIAASVFDVASIVKLGEGFAPCATTGFASIGGVACGFVGTNGALCADGSAKIARFVRLCDSFSIPVITFVDCDGFVPSSAAELSGSIRDGARLAHAYAEATTAKIALVVGKAIGSAYVAFSNNDIVLAWPNAVISAMKPEAAVAFMWTEKLAGSSDPIADRKALVKEYETTEASPFAAAKVGCVSDVIDPSATREELIKAVDMLSSKRVSGLPKKHGNMPL